MPGRHHQYKCRHCGYEGRKSRAMWHVVKEHMDPQDAPFRCSSCSFRAQTYTETYKHVQEVHPQGEVHANPNPYVATFQHTHPEEWDLKVVEAEVKVDVAEPARPVIPSTSVPVALAQPTYCQEPTVRETVASVKTQIITANVTLGQVKAKTSDVSAATSRIEGKVNDVARSLRHQDIRIIQDATVTIQESARRSMEAAEKFASAVDSFKTGIFPLVQALIDGQKALAVQLQKQGEVIQSLVQKPIAQATTTRPAAPSILATGDWYGRQEFEEAWNSTANVPNQKTAKRPIVCDTLFKEPAAKRPHVEPNPAIRSAPIQQRIFNKRRFQMREMPKVTPISEEELARRKLAREKRHQEQEARAKQGKPPRNPKPTPKPVRRAILLEDKENETPKTKEPKTPVKVISEATKKTDVAVCADVTNEVTKEVLVEPTKDVPVQDTLKEPLPVLKQSDGYGLDDSSSDSGSESDSDTENEDNWKRQ